VSPSELPDLLRAAVARLAPVIPVGQELGRRFAEAGHELALVGGPVRDAFIGRTSPDLDFTTDATPDETLAVILGWADAHWEIGKAFGTIGLRKGKYLIEVTTYRSDVYDRTSRKPSVTFGTTLSDDLVRRDFTVNAMAVRFPTLEFVDEHGGLADLASASCAPRRRPRSRSRTTRSVCSAPPGSPRSSASRWPLTCRPP